MNNPQTPSTVNAPSGGPDKPNGKGHHLWMWIPILLVIFLGVGFLYVIRGKKPKTPAPPPVSISVTNVQKGDIDVAVSSLGSVQPIYTATMSPRVDGQLISVNYTEGQMVSSNDLLAVIDPGPYQAALTQATGQLERDKAMMEGHKVDLDRFHDAYLKNAIPKQQYDDEVALVHQDEGTVKLDEGQLENARVQLAYAYIRAPFSGRVGLRQIDPGNVVHAANTNAIVVVAQLQPITVIFNVAEDYLPQIQEQMRGETQEGAPSIAEGTTPEMQQTEQPTRQMTVEAWDRADENKIATGKVLALNNLIDAATGTIRLKAVFENTNLNLFPNQFVNARLIIKTIHDASLIPTFAIQHNPEGAFVYVVTNMTVTNNGVATNAQVVTMRTIVTGTADGNSTAVTQGLEPGEMIAVDNFNKLGEKVQISLRSPAGTGRGGAGKHSGGSYSRKSGDGATNATNTARDNP